MLKWLVGGIVFGMAMAITLSASTWLWIVLVAAIGQAVGLAVWAALKEPAEEEMVE
jgi:hypothetical protein